jgi:hypothetical protein
MSVEAKTKDNDYEVGYGRPPHHSRFKKGQSGNPTGRRRYTDSERGRQLLRQEANRLVTVRDGAKTFRISAFQAALRSLFLSAAKGNPSAQKTMLNAVRAIEEADGDNNPARLVISCLFKKFLEPINLLISQLARIKLIQKVGQGCLRGRCLLTTPESE